MNEKNLTLYDALLDRYPILQFFEYEHLPSHLQEVSKPFGDLARQMADALPRNAETSTMLRKLREAKDCAVAAKLQRVRQQATLANDAGGGSAHGASGGAGGTGYGAGGGAGEAQGHVGGGGGAGALFSQSPNPKP